MLNTEIIKVFGEENRAMNTELVEYLGEDIANECYVISKDYVYLNGAFVPQFFATALDDKRSVEAKLLNFADMYISDTEEFEGMFVIYDRIPGEEDVRLCLF